ncbi:MAG: metal ABC transporter permease [Spirochaetales bacterium]
MAVFDVLQFAPILRGAVVLVVAGTIFPLVGVFVLRLNLITLRFALMHSSLLGSAVALAAGWSPLFAGLIANTILISVVASAGSRTGTSASHVTNFFMVFTIGLAFAILYRFDVPARESLGLLWGNIFALTPTDAVVTAGFALVVLAVIVILFGRITAVLYDRDIAFTSGVNEKAISAAILFIVGFTITLVMGLIGALLLDAVLILPALIAGVTAKSTRALFVTASLWGLLISVSGFVFAVEIDIPASSGVTLVGASVLGLVGVYRRISGRRERVYSEPVAGIGSMAGNFKSKETM